MRREGRAGEKREERGASKERRARKERKERRKERREGRRYLLFCSPASMIVMGLLVRTIVTPAVIPAAPKKKYSVKKIKE